MDSLTNKPDVLFLIAIRHVSLVKLTLVPKLRRDIYRTKILKAMTYIEHITYKDGHSTTYYVIDQIHREDGPAVIVKRWYVDAFIDAEAWFYKGKLHRISGPAEVVKNFRTIWAKHGKVHREDGPAIVDPHNAVGKWCYEGYYVSSNEVDELVKKTKTIDDIKSYREIQSRDTFDMYSTYLFV